MERPHLVLGFVFFDIQLARGVNDSEVPQVSFCTPEEALTVNILAQVAFDIPETHGKRIRLEVVNLCHDLLDRTSALMVDGPP